MIAFTAPHALTRIMHLRHMLMFSVTRMRAHTYYAVTHTHTLTHMNTPQQICKCTQTQHKSSSHFHPLAPPNTHIYTVAHKHTNTQTHTHTHKPPHTHTHTHTHRMLKRLIPKTSVASSITGVINAHCHPGL